MTFGEGLPQTRPDGEASPYRFGVMAGDEAEETLSPAAFSSWSRVVAPGHTACDGFPRCPYEGTGDDLKAHQRECRRSEVGALFRVLRGRSR